MENQLSKSLLSEFEDSQKCIELIENNLKLISEKMITKLKSKNDNLGQGKYKKWIVLYHAVDIDGQGIRILTEIIMKYKKEIEVLFVPCYKRADEGYETIKNNLKDYDVCIIADLNFTEEYAEKVNDELDTDKIILLDHHKHALFLNEYKWSFVETHDINNFNISSGTILYYLFIDDLLQNIFLECDSIDLENFMDQQSNLVTLSFIYQTIYSFVISTACYDTWFAKDPTTEKISYIINDGYTPEYLNMLFKSNKKEYRDVVINNILNSLIIIDEKSKLIIETTQRIIKSHCTFIWHNCKIMKCENNKIAAICFSDNYISEVGNYILSKQPEVDFVIIINPNVNSIGLRSRNEEGFVDVSEIAKNNNGGGHPQASGFPMENDIILKLIKDILKTHFSENIKNISSIKEFKFDDGENYNYIIDL